MDRALLECRVGEDGGAGLRRGAKARKGPKIWHWSHSFPGTAGFLLSAAGCAHAFGAAPQFHFFLLLGEGRKEESKEGDLGGLAIKLFSCLALPETSLCVLLKALISSPCSRRRKM